jgi:hypothetical protein
MTGDSIVLQIDHTDNKAYPIIADFIGKRVIYIFMFIPCSPFSVSFEYQHNVCGRSIYTEGTIDAAIFLHRKVGWCVTRAIL